MLFSIIIPVYNVESYLKECVESILNQSYKDYEIILVDDGSTDNSGSICDDYAGKYSKISAEHKVNGGLSDARNYGLKKANGEYVLFIDSDDFIVYKDFLSDLSGCVIKSPDMVLFKYAKYFHSKHRFGTCCFSYCKAQHKEDYAECLMELVRDDAFYGMAWIKAIRRDFLQNNHIEFEVGLLGEDMEWNYHLITKAKHLVLLDKVAIAYRQREGSITASHKIKNLTDFIYILEKWSSSIDRTTKDPTLRLALLGSLAKYYSNLLVVYTRLKDPRKIQYVNKIKALSWLLKSAMSKRPKFLHTVMKVVGFKGLLQVLALICR